MRPEFPIFVPIQHEQASSERIFMDVGENQQFGTPSLGKLLPTKKRRGSTGAAVIRNPGSHVSIHRITSDARIGFPVGKLRHRAISWTFEDFFSLNVRSQRAFALANDVVNVRPIWTAVADVAQGPASRTGLAGDEHRIVWNQ